MTRKQQGALGAILACAAVAIAGVLAAPALLAADPDALWKIVHGLCVPHQEVGLDPAPCAYVNLGSAHARGYALLKDRTGDTQYLLIPTDKVTGIEDPQLLRSGSESYLAQAWAFRSLLLARLGHELPDHDLALAINSLYGRSQNQLHIHIDCVRPTVRDTLASEQAGIGPELRPLSSRFSGHAYLAMSMPATGLERTNLFRLLSGRVPAGTMGRETLAVIGVTLPSGQPGFDVLVDRANLAVGDAGTGEELQDHDCALRSDPAPAG